MQQHDMSETQLLQEVIDGLGKASGSASQLIHTHGHPGFIAIRDMLDIAKDGLAKSAVAKATKPRTVFI